MSDWQRLEELVRGACRDPDAQIPEVAAAIEEEAFLIIDRLRRREMELVEEAEGAADSFVAAMGELRDARYRIDQLEAYVQEMTNDPTVVQES